MAIDDLVQHSAIHDSNGPNQGDIAAVQSERGISRLAWLRLELHKHVDLHRCPPWRPRVMAGHRRRFLSNRLHMMDVTYRYAVESDRHSPQWLMR